MRARVLRSWLLTAACLLGAEPEFLRNLFPAGGGEPVAIGRMGATRYVRFPGGPWTALTDNDSPDAQAYTLQSYWAGDAGTVHMVGDWYAVVEAKRFGGVYGPSEDMLQGPNASPLAVLREAFRREDARLNATWKQLRPRLSAGEQWNRVVGEQKAWLSNMTRFCRQFPSEEGRLHCSTAFTVARNAVLAELKP